MSEEVYVVYQGSKAVGMTEKRQEADALLLRLRVEYVLQKLKVDIDQFFKLLSETDFKVQQKKLVDP